jgi:REP element-mobilizing transposase RayT
MIHGYHVNWGTYGFWLPNDPRGSWSEFVGSWELVRFGKATKSLERLDRDSRQWALRRAAALKALKLPSVSLSGAQIEVVAAGFATGIRKSRYTIWACSILQEHVHLVVARHTYHVESICNLLKGEATKQLKAHSLHPMARFEQPNCKVPSLWAENQWKVHLDTEAAIDGAIRYVEDNPGKEGRPAQKWPFVTPFAGISRSGWTTYH